MDDKELGFGVIREYSFSSALSNNNFSLVLLPLLCDGTLAKLLCYYTLINYCIDIDLHGFKYPVM